VNLPLLLAASGFVAQGLALRYHRRQVGAAAAIAVLLLAAALAPTWTSVLLVVAALGPMTVVVVATLAGSAPWSGPERLAVATGLLGAGATVLTRAVGAQDLLQVVAGVAGALVLGVLMLAGARDEPARRVRALWLAVGGGVVFVAAAGFWGLLPQVPAQWCTAVVSLALPASVVLAVRAPRRVDVRWVAVVTVLHTVTMLAVVAVVSGLLAGGELLTGATPDRAVELLALVLGCAGYAPLLGVLRPHVEALLFGRNLDPLPVLADLGRELRTGTTASWLEAVCRGCGLPWAQLWADGKLLAGSGTPGSESVLRTDLPMDGQTVGELRVGLDPLSNSAPRQTLLVLELLATPLAHAVRGARLAADLQLSRERTVAARDEERRRVGHDLHDGLGATLTGLGYSADAAARLLDQRPEAARKLLVQLRADTQDALALVRRTVSGLRPAELDGGGLLIALERFCARYRAAGFAVELEFSTFPDPPADVALAVHRIVGEAVTNAARHADCTRVMVRLHSAAGELLVRVEDDGAGREDWRPGTGLASMRDRAEVLGGRLRAGPGAAGGVVELRLPVVQETGVQETGVVPEIVADPSTRVPE